MDDLSYYCFRLSRSQGLSYSREIRVNYDTILILRGVALSNISSVAPRRVIQIPLDIFL